MPNDDPEQDQALCELVADGDDPLEFVHIVDVTQHGDPGKWARLGHKDGSPAIAKSKRAPPGSWKVMEEWEDECGSRFELHFFRHADGSVSNVKTVP